MYLDASAAAKLLVEEDESAALAARLDALTADVDIVSSALLETELRRLAVREGLRQPAVSEVLDRVSLVAPSRSIFYEAGLLPGSTLRSLDALHLGTALRMDRCEVVAYDAGMLAGAQALGLRTASPA